MTTATISGDLFANGRVSASGFLRSEDMVFYHPLDNYADGIHGDEWEGSAAFWPSLVGSGVGLTPLSAVKMVDEFDFPLEGYVFGRTPVWLLPIQGEPNKKLFVYEPRESNVYAHVLEINDDNSVTIGDAAELPIGTKLVGDGPTQTIHISGDLYAGIYDVDRGISVGVASLSVSGNTASWGPANEVWSMPTTTTKIGYKMVASPIPFAASGGFLVSYYEDFEPYNLFVRYCAVNTSGEIIANDPTIIPSGIEPMITAVSSTQAVIGYKDLTSDISPDKYVFRVVEISGTNISLNSIYNIDMYMEESPLNIATIDESHFLLFRRDNYDNNELRTLTVYKINGTNISAVASGFDPYPTQHAQMEHLFLQSTSGCLIIGEQNTSIKILRFNIDDDYGIHIGQELTYDYSDKITVTYNSCCAFIGGNRVLLFDASSNKMRVAIEPANEIASQSPLLYKSSTGASGLTLAGRTKVSDAIFIHIDIGCDCNICINSGYISLADIPSDAGVRWNSSNVIEYIGLLGGGQFHSMVLDFRYQGNAIWKLYTSIDGDGWTDHGSQNSGTLSLIGTASPPHISFMSGDANQYLDEVAIWSNAAQFTPDELSKLHALSKYSYPMSEYSGIDFSVIEELLYCSVHGYSQVVGSGDLHVNGRCGFCLTVHSPLSIVNNFKKNEGYSPYLIGYFAEQAEGVCIDIWDTVNGQNSRILLQDSACTRIGNTNCWGWSTRELLSAEASERRCFYTMTSSNGYLYHGRFVFR